jgi:hypothetical protein
MKYCYKFFLISILSTVLLNKVSHAQNKTLFLGISKKTESFNIENIGNSQVSALDNIQYNQSKFFSSFNLYAEFRAELPKSFYTAIRGYMRYNHHYYTKLLKPGVATQDLPQKRKCKADIVVDMGRIFTLKKGFAFFVSLGIGVNNINSGYDFTYNDTTSFGQPFTKNFKGNWTKFTPSVVLGISKGKYQFSTDIMFTQDPNFQNLTSVITGFTLARRLATFGK